MRVLVVDNYDSFVYNLVQYLAQLGADTTVRRNDEVDLDELDDVDAVLVSPGPGLSSTPSYCPTDARSTSSLRTTVHSAPSCARYCTMLNTKLS